MVKPTGISSINRIDSILKQQNWTRKSLCDDLEIFEKVEKLLKEEKGNKMNRRNVTAMTSNNNQEDYRCQKSWTFSTKKIL